MVFESKLEEILVKEGISKVQLQKHTGLSSALIQRATKKRQEPKLVNQYKILKAINEILRVEKYTLNDIF